MSGTRDVPPCHFHELPDELLLAIFSHFETRRGFLVNDESELVRKEHNDLSRCALHALTLTSRRLAAVATPLLYTCVVQNILCSVRVLLLLPTLAAKPALRRHIRYLEIEGPYRIARRNLPASYDVAIVDAISQSLTGAEFLHPPTRAAFQKTTAFLAFLNGDISSYTDIMWHHMCRVEGVTFPLLAVIILIMISENLSEVAHNTPDTLDLILASKRFSDRGLQTLWVREDHFPQYIRIIKAMPGKNNSLQQYIQYTSDTYGLPEVAASQIGEVAIEVADLEPDLLDDSLRGCCALRHFSCRWHSQIGSRSGFTGCDLGALDFPYMNKMLHAFKTSLVTLTIDTKEIEWQVDEFDLELTSTLGSLRDFTSLKHLDVCRFVLHGNSEDPGPEFSDILPESLESLRIQTPWDSALEEAFNSLIPNCKSRLPHLSRIECSWWLPDIVDINHDFLSSPEDKIVTAFLEVGVEFIPRPSLSSGEPSISSASGSSYGGIY